MEKDKLSPIRKALIVGLNIMGKSNENIDITIR